MTVLAIRPSTYGDLQSFRRFSVLEYQRMIEAGILDANDKVELLEGQVVLKMARNPKHDSTIQRMLPVLYPLLPQGWSWRVQSAVTLEDSQPEPDFALVRGSADDYEARHPGAVDIGLLVEVADSSLLRDTADKARIYARAGVAHYWIVNLVDDTVVACAHPSGPTPVPDYGNRQAHDRGVTLAITVDGTSFGPVRIADLLP